MRAKPRPDRSGPGHGAPLHVRFVDAIRRKPAAFALVTGCPRSGTTAVIEWLADQPGVAAFNESRVLLAAHRFLDEVDRFSALSRASSRLAALLRTGLIDHYRSVARRSGRLIIDKEPLEPVALPDGGYERFLLHVRSVFPDARVLHLVRHPVPTIWSMLNRRWGYSLTSGELRDFTLEECLQAWKANASLAATLTPDPALRVCRFEDLTGSPDRESRSILEFLGIRHGTAFSPRPTAAIGFEPEVRDRILEATQDERRRFGY